MVIEKLIFDFVICMFDIAAVYYLVVYNKKERKFGNVFLDIASISGCAILMVLFGRYFEQFIGIPSVVYIFLYIFVRFVYGVGIARFLAMTFIYFTLTIISEFTIVAVNALFLNIDFNMLLEFNQYRVIFSILSKIILAVLVYLADKYFVNKKIELSPSSIMIMVVLLTNFVMGAILVNMYSENAVVANMEYGSNALIMLFIGILMLSMFFIVFLRYMLSVERKSMELEATEKEYKIMTEYIKEIEGVYSDLRANRHDYINHIETIAGLAENENVLQIKEYAGSILEAQTTELTKIDVGNTLVNAILSYKRRKAEEKNIIFEYDIAIPDQLDIKDIDLAIMLSNALNNAIEACERISSSRYIKIKMDYKMGLLRINIRNSFDGRVVRKGEYFVTKKQDKANHGIGLVNIEKTINKYDGHMQVTLDGQEFILSMAV